jgi:hypothetical protein
MAISVVTRDLRFAARLLWRDRLFTLTAALSIAVGIAADTAVFSVANALLFRTPVGVTAPERLVDISRAGAGGSILGFLSYAEYVELRERVTTFDGLYGHDLAPKPMNLAVSGGAERVLGNVVTTTFFDVLGVRPAAGRLFGANDSDQRGASPYVVLSHRYWLRRFDGHPDVIGTPVTLNGQALTIVGVAPEGFQGTTILAPTCGCLCRSRSTARWRPPLSCCSAAA